MNNCILEVEGNKLTITVDLTKDFGLSKSGKTIQIASTQGNQKISSDVGDVTIGLNVYKYKER